MERLGAAIFADETVLAHATTASGTVAALENPDADVHMVDDAEGQEDDGGLAEVPARAEWCHCNSGLNDGSNWETMVSCARGDMCVGGQWYHPECVFGEIPLPNGQPLRTPESFGPVKPKSKGYAAAKRERQAYVSSVITDAWLCQACTHDDGTVIAQTTVRTRAGTNEGTSVIHPAKKARTPAGVTLTRPTVPAPASPRPPRNPLPTAVTGIRVCRYDGRGNGWGGNPNTPTDWITSNYPQGECLRIHPNDAEPLYPSRRNAYEVTGDVTRLHSTVAGVYYRNAPPGTNAADPANHGPAFAFFGAWEDYVQHNGLVFVVFGEFPAFTTQCTTDSRGSNSTANRDRHGIHPTRDDREDPNYLRRAAHFPRIRDPNCIIFGGPDVDTLEILMASTGPTVTPQPGLTVTSFGMQPAEQRAWSALMIHTTARKGLIQPKGWRNENGARKPGGGPRFRRLRGSPSLHLLGTIHGGVHLPSSYGKDAQGNAKGNHLPRVTGEAREPDKEDVWAEYVALGNACPTHRRIAAFHEFLDPEAHAARRQVIDAFPAICQAFFPYGSIGSHEVANGGLSADCHTDPKDAGYTIQFVHGNYTKGAIAFPGLRVSVELPSGSISAMRTQRLEHLVLDFDRKPNVNWEHTYRYSHPVTFPSGMFSSFHAHRREWEEQRFGFLGQASRREWVALGAVRTDFNPADDLPVLDRTAIPPAGGPYMHNEDPDGPGVLQSTLTREYLRLALDYTRDRREALEDRIREQDALQADRQAGRAYTVQYEERTLASLLGLAPPMLIEQPEA
jgi:hypothetical protein